MKNQMPHFKYCSASAANNQAACIKVEGQTIHKIENLDEYYKELGYTPDIKKAGLLPDEFIWIEYTQNINVKFADCIQIRIIKYLIKHSDTFRRKYGNQCESWIADHAKETVMRGIACAACRMEPSCEK